MAIDIQTIIKGAQRPASGSIFDDLRPDLAVSPSDALVNDLISNVLAAQDPSNYVYRGVLTPGGLDIGDPNREILSRTQTPVDLLGAISIEDGISQDEIDYVTDLLTQGLVTVADVSARTGIPESEIQAVYDQQRREPSVLELLQTGPVRTVDVEGGIGDVAGTGGITAEEEVDLSQRTTDDLTEDTTASTVDGGDLTIIPENPWIYQGGGVFRNERTGETVYNEDAETNPAYVIGGSYSGPDSGTQDVEVSVLPGATVDVAGGIGDIATVTPAVTNGGLVGDTVVQKPTGTPGTVKQVTGDGTGDGIDDGTEDGTGDGAGGVRNGLIMMLAQQAPITEQMFSRELFEPQMKELNNVAKALGMLQSIARPFV